MVNIKMCLCVCVIILVISLTPAFAVEMGEVANQAEELNKQSKEEMGFWGQLSFMSKAYWLISDLEESQDNINPLDDEDIGEMENEIADQHLKQAHQKNKLLKFRNRETQKNNNIKTTNKTSNNTNITETSISQAIPQECTIDANNIIELLQQQGITVSQSNQQFNENLQGSIAQIIDTNGEIRYAYIKNINSKDNNPYITLIIDNNTEKQISLKEFKKAFTGLILKTNNIISPESIISTIINLQENKLEKQLKTTAQLKNKSRNEINNSKIKIAIGIVLFIIGALIATILGRSIANTIKENPMSHIVQVDNPEALAEEVDYLNSNELPGSVREPASPSNIIRSHRITLRALEEDFEGAQLIDNVNSLNMAIGMAGLSIILASTSEIIGAIASQLYIRAIVCFIGLALVIFSTYWVITNILNIVFNCGVEERSIEFLSSDLDDFDYLDKWLDVKGTVKKDNNPLKAVNTTDINNQNLTNGSVI